MIPFHGQTLIGKEFVPEGTNTAYVHRRTLTAPAAASATAIHAAMTAAGVVTTGITNPDFPRNATIIGGGSGHAASGNVVLTGIDMRDAVITETLTLNGNTSVAGNKAFKAYTKIDTSGVTGMDANNTVSVGTGTKFGLTRKMDSDGVIKATTDGAADTLPTVAFSTSAISSNTVIPATAANGAHNYVFTYITNDIYVPGN